MSKVAYPLIDGWLGFGDGSSVLLETGSPLDADHPAVLERPELFTIKDEGSAFTGAAPVKRAKKAAPSGGTDG